jgi:hypothetical protein
MCSVAAPRRGEDERRSRESVDLVTPVLSLRDLKEGFRSACDRSISPHPLDLPELISHAIRSC